MHGRKKSDLPQTKEEKDAVQAKISNYMKVIGAIRHKRAAGEMDEEYKGLLGKLLRLHPDFYSMWNFRKEAVLQEIGRIGEDRSNSSEGRDKALGAVYEEELALSVDCIKRNPKSYPAWHHHKWALEKGLDFLGGSAILKEDLALCGSFLELDGRNFHCWAHRMWVAEKMGLSASDNLDFTTTKIMQNFSNYSAFHVRSKMLPRIVQEDGCDRWHLLQRELDITHDAMFTEPADQSVWWYYHFLLTWAEGAGDGREDIYANVLRDERYTLRDLVEVEGRCKWAELALLLVTKRLIGWLRREKSPRVTHLDGDKAAAAADEGDKGLPEVASLEESCLGMASRLAKLDPMHARFYAFVEQGGSVWRNNNHQLPQEKQEEVDGAADAVVGGIA